VIENRNFESPIYGRDKDGNLRTWPLFAGPVAPEDLGPWACDVPDYSLPVLVQPGVLHDPMEVQR
jgi:hypothetical protein